MIVKDFFRPWMKAYIWTFGHPYFAVTAADGTFTMPRVPAGVKLRMLAWHEARGWLHGKDGKMTTLDNGKIVGISNWSALTIRLLRIQNPDS